MVANVPGSTRSETSRTAGTTEGPDPNDRETLSRMTMGEASVPGSENSGSERKIARRGSRRPRFLVRTDERLGEAHLVHFVRSVGEARPARIGEHLRERRIVRVTERSVHLD